VFENYADGVATITSKSGWKWTDVIHDLGLRYSDWAHQDFVVGPSGSPTSMPPRRPAGWR
jgi:hypothetical protein